MTTEERLIEKAKQLLDRINSKHEGLRYTRLEKDAVIRDGSTKDVHILTYNVHSGMEFPSYFIFIDAKTEEFLYIITKHGYIEIE